MTSKPILIGEAPSKRGDSTKPLDYKCFERLGAVKMNLFYTREPIENNGGRWPSKEADRKAGEIARDLFLKIGVYSSSCPVLFVGKRVAKAFDFEEDYFVWRTHWGGGFRCAIFPHPSGLNRWWNDTRNRRRAAEFLEGI